MFFLSEALESVSSTVGEEKLTETTGSFDLKFLHDLLRNSFQEMIEGIRFLIISNF